MRTIEQCNLSLMIWSLARNEENVQTSLVSWEFRCNRLRSLDHPEMEDFTLYHEIVLISDTLMNLLYGILRITRHNTVNEGTIYSAGLLEPCLEFLAELPELDVLVDALLEFLAVKEDKLAWENDESLAHVAVEMLVSVIQKLCEFAWI